MRNILASIVLVALAASAQAQRQPFQPGAGGTPGGFSLRAMVMQSKVLQEELKITEEQLDAFKAFTEKQTDAMKKFATMGGSDEDQIERMTIQLQLLKDRVAMMKKTLTKEQDKRLHQIELQQQGIAALANDKVAKELQLSDEQKEKIKSTVDGMRKEMSELQRGGFGGGFDPEKFQEMQKKIKTIREEASEKMEKALTKEQRSNWKDMLGETFDMSKLLPMRRQPKE